MQKPAIEKVLPQDFKIEIPEVKKSLPLRRIDEELSNSKEHVKPARRGPWDKTRPLWPVTSPRAQAGARSTDL